MPNPSRFNPMPPVRNSAAVIANFDGDKFAAAHGITVEDFEIRGSTLHYPPSLGNNAAQEAVDAPVTRPNAEIEAVEDGTATLAQMRTALAYLIGRMGA